MQTRYQFQIDGRPAAPVRDDWHSAARDAVAAGCAVWRYHKQAISLADAQGADIARIREPAKQQ